ncbi:FecR/PupR family sigma factor regulator [Zavarzinia compransoris]|uniref:FecR N-terminal domain-containing protein n=1 Tax=Zavarzinia compransoris TaxID=1264899 RepID=A0A317E7I8_9PROT|nr:DUF4880 domain-containing protein [Zavarzinia compransoris]PWR23027.1 hypothetical protein DKG75_00150 [Zavarzinia compransoris]TDP46428.1 uncharacterized protein DUF4880 [Zavarzinia compransoris]
MDDRRETLLKEAAGWLARLRERPDDDDLRRAIAGWLALDSAHWVAWSRARRAMAMLGEIPPAFDARWAGRVEPPEPPLSFGARLRRFLFGR